MKITKIILLSLLSCQFAFGQQKSQTSVIEFKEKSVNSFSIIVPQSMSFVEPLFKSKFDLNQFDNTSIKEGKFDSFFQIKMSKISNNQIDFYYNLAETQSDNGSFVAITLMLSKGYDNFISRDTDKNITSKILEILDEIGSSVERKNLEIQIVEKEKLMQNEKNKLLFIEQELRVFENEKNQMNNRIIEKSKVLANQSKVAQEIGNELQKLRYSLSDFEKKTVNKSKSTLKTISKQ